MKTLINKTKNLTKKHVMLFFFTFTALSATFCGGDDSPWVMKINGQKFTAHQINTAYETYLSISAPQLQMPVEKLKELIANPDQVENPQIRMILENLSKKAFLEYYKRMVMSNMQAENEGFTDSIDVKAKLDFSNKYFLYNLYLMEKIGSDSIQISDEEAIKAWEMMKKARPDLAQYPIAQGLQAAKQQLSRQKLMKMQAEFEQKVLESYTVEYNSDYKFGEKESGASNSQEKTPETK